MELICGENIYLFIFLKGHTWKRYNLIAAMNPINFLCYSLSFCVVSSFTEEGGVWLLSLRGEQGAKPHCYLCLAGHPDTPVC